MYFRWRNELGYCREHLEKRTVAPCGRPARALQQKQRQHPSDEGCNMITTLNPDVLRWARSNAALTEDALADKTGVPLSDVKEWETTGKIKIKLISALAEATWTALGYLFLDNPPTPNLPIADFRRQNDLLTSSPSRELLEVIYDAQLKQSWYRDYLKSNGHEPLGFVGACTVDIPPKQTAIEIRRTLNIGPAMSAMAKKWEEVIRLTTESAEDNGIIVIRTGHLRSNNSRTLSSEEFRGFALVDEYAPLIFVNGEDAPASQLFTMAHEIAHVWLGTTGVSNLRQTYSTGGRVESYCNAVAAEVLLPIEEIKLSWHGEINDTSEISRLSDKYKVSRIVVARRARDAGLLTEDKFNSIYPMFAKKPSSQGGNYYVNERYQNSKLFSIALVQETIAGRVSQGDAMRFLGIKKEATFKKYANSLKEGMEWLTY
jgi:Zn-dependent peptidase ImmA (M78 family)